MEAASQVILRNEARLPQGQLLLVNPPRDTLANRLLQSGRPLRCSTQDFGDMRWLQSGSIETTFEVAPVLDGGEAAVMLFLPREKERLGMLLHAIASQMNPEARLWLVGENRSGIKSSPRHLSERYELVNRLDNARHCGLIEATRPRKMEAFNLDDYFTNWSCRFAGREIQLRSLPGVFAHGRLDRGTQLLLQVLEQHTPQGRVLDFACGCGIIGLAALVSTPAVELTMLDSSAAALESSRRSLRVNGLSATVLPSDGLNELHDLEQPRFDWIISNPPFHRGVANDLDIAADFFRRAGTFLTENGRIVIVFNRHLPYFQWLRETYDQVDILADNGEFIVIQARQPSGKLHGVNRGVPGGRKHQGKQKTHE